MHSFTITPTLCPPKYSLMTSSEPIVISWQLRRLTESRFIRRQDLTFSSKPALYSQSHCSVSKSGVTLHSFVVQGQAEDHRPRKTAFRCCSSRKLMICIYKFCMFYVTLIFFFFLRDRNTERHNMSPSNHRFFLNTP